MQAKFLLLVLALGACATTPNYSSQTPTDRNAYGVVAANLSARIPGQNVQPYASCIMQNSTPAEILNISNAGVGVGSSNIISTIVARPQTSQCIARAARATPTRSATAPSSAAPVQQASSQPVYFPPIIQAPIVTFPTPQVTPLSLPGSNRVQCTNVGINTFCR